MPEPENPDDILACIAAELERIGRECLLLQTHDDETSLRNVDPAEIRRRQLIDRITQELSGVLACLTTYIASGDAAAALTAPTMISQRERMKAACDGGGGDADDISLTARNAEIFS